MLDIYVCIHVGLYLGWDYLEILNDIYICLYIYTYYS